ncbi:MAG: hypothetical protein ACRET3_09885 [Burkholderiales bacterium]
MPSQYSAVQHKRFGPYESVNRGEYNPGDLVLVRSETFFAKLIRFGQRLAYPDTDRKYTGWSHAAIIVDDDGNIVEAIARGVKRCHIGSYDATDYAVVSVSQIANERDRRQAVTFAEKLAGLQYGWMTAMSVGLSLFFGWRLVFSVDRQFICSGLVARCLERMDIPATADESQLASTPTHVKPADLARLFDCPLEVRERDVWIWLLAIVVYIVGLLLLAAVVIGIYTVVKFLFS